MGNLIVKSILGFAFLMLVLALILFISAGSLRFWQAWVYLAVFASCTLLITVYLFKYDQDLLASRIKAGPVAETQKRQQLIQSLASLCFMGLFVVSGLDFRFYWSEVPPVVSGVADGFVILSFKEQPVIAGGPYRLVRHPMYAGASLLLLVSPLALGSWVALPIPVLLILVIMVRLLEEARFLQTDLSGYEAYCQKVRYHLIPFIW
jgi:protein-S-isoprenylcysteine O-methyltransferase Ste14